MNSRLKSSWLVGSVIELLRWLHVQGRPDCLPIHYEVSRSTTQVSGSLNLCAVKLLGQLDSLK